MFAAANQSARNDRATYGRCASLVFLMGCIGQLEGAELPDAPSGLPSRSDASHDASALQDGAVTARDEGTSDAPTDLGIAADGDIEDAGSTDANVPDRGLPEDGGVLRDAGALDDPVLIAQGELERYLYSCDHGLSWQTLNEGSSERCRSAGGSVDCFHDETSAQGLVFLSDGRWLGARGWGRPGTIEALRGRSWEVLYASDHGRDAAGSLVAYEDVAYAATLYSLVTLSGSPSEWTRTPKPSLNARMGATMMLDSGPVLIHVLSGLESGVIVSRDGGATWNTPAVWSETDCGNFWRGVAGGGSTIAVFDRDGACVSDDRGETFSRHELPETITGNAIYHRGEFHVFGTNVVFQSTDARSWRRVETSGLSLRPRRYGIAGNGTWVATGGEYDSQRFFHSEDGIEWIEARAPAGHAIGFFTLGEDSQRLCD